MSRTTQPPIRRGAPKKIGTGLVHSLGLDMLAASQVVPRDATIAEKVAAPLGSLAIWQHKPL